MYDARIPAIVTQALLDFIVQKNIIKEKRKNYWIWSIIIKHIFYRFTFDSALNIQLIHYVLHLNLLNQYSQVFIYLDPHILPNNPDGFAAAAAGAADEAVC